MKKSEQLKDSGRRNFIRTVGLTTAATLFLPKSSWSMGFKGKDLRVWSCGGLAEALIAANKLYEKDTGAKVTYTGAFAAALGKALMTWAETDVFACRVLDLAKKLRAANKMAYFKPLCFTEYLLITPKGNPAGIKSVRDLARPDVRVVLAPDASPPGGKAILAILSKAGVKDAAMRNAVVKGSCVQRTMKYIIDGEGDVSVVERRVTRIPQFKNEVDIIPISDELQPIHPLTFTVGVMNSTKNHTLADHYVEFITSKEGQFFFERQGFIPAISKKGQELIEKLGVKDV